MSQNCQCPYHKKEVRSWLPESGAVATLNPSLPASQNVCALELVEYSQGRVVDAELRYINTGKSEQ